MSSTTRSSPATTWKGQLPYTIIVNEKGEVVYREFGELSFLKMRRAIVPELDRIKPWGGLSPIKPELRRPGAISVRSAPPIRLLFMTEQEANVCVLSPKPAI